jgi:hypothetical protein
VIQAQASPGEDKDDPKGSSSTFIRHFDGSAAVDSGVRSRFQARDKWVCFKPDSQETYSDFFQA